MPCPLCAGSKTSPFYQESYSKCQECNLIFTLPEFILSNTKEKLRYDEHNNDPQDSNYRFFLSKISLPLIELLKVPSSGLDFGCGSGPTLSLLLEEAGHEVELFDPYYYPDKSILTKQYDFITSTEVFEHLNSPKKEMNTISSALKPGAYLAIMTQLYNEDINFESWWYKNDPTHICFYRKETFEWIAKEYSFRIIQCRGSIVILQKL